MQFEDLYRQYFGDVYRFLLKLSGSPDVAEEITSETFFKAMRALDSYRGDCALSVWLCQIAKNCYYTYLKKQKRQSGADELPDAAWEPDVAEQVLRWAEAAWIKQRLHTLPEPYKEVFMWRVFAEMPFADIGNMFGKSANWACVTYHRARKMLLERLEETP